MPIVRFDEVTCLADWAAGQRQARTAGRAGAGQCAAGGGEGMGRSEPWGLVRGAPWPPPAVRCTLSLSSLICRRGAVRVSRLEVLRSGWAGLPPGMPPGSEGLGPRCWWRPLPSPAARPPLDLGRRQHLAAPPGDGGPTRGRGPHQGSGAPPGAGGRAVTVEAAGHTLLPGPAPGPCRAGIWGGRASGGRGPHDLSPLASVSPPVQWGAAGSPFTRSVGGFEVRMPDSDGVLASGARPAAEEAAVWGGPVLAEGSHWC